MTSTLKASNKNLDLILHVNKPDQLEKVRAVFQKYPYLEDAAIAASIVGNRKYEVQGVTAEKIINLAEILDSFGGKNNETELAIGDLVRYLEAGIDRPDLKHIKACNTLAELKDNIHTLRFDDSINFYKIEGFSAKCLFAFRFYLLLEDEESDAEPMSKNLVELYVERHLDDESDEPDETIHLTFLIDDDSSMEKARNQIKAFLAS